MLTRDPKARRPLLHTSYSSDMALFNTRAKRNTVIVLFLVAAALPFVLADAEVTTLARGSAYAIGAIGLGLLTGYAGQISLGHAFFAGIGFYTAAVIGGDPDGRSLGLGISEVLIWLPAAGLVAAAVGVLVAPLAVRLRGLYLAIVTLGLVFVGEHAFEELDSITGGPSTGRPPPALELFGYPLGEDGDLFSRAQQLYWLLLVLLVLFAVAARNIARSNIGRAFTAIRDRDIAAGIIGVNLVKQKTIAFAISSFYAGCAGALFYTTFLNVNPNQFNLFLSVLFIVMVLIGGVGTISGAIAGAFLIAVLPRITEELAAVLPYISTRAQDVPNVSHMEFVLYGLLIIGFLVFEPRGLVGIWTRIRNWWKAYPFSY
ncbi:MAG: branched-chain amino acid ABC transporter permease [Actinomycetota bacterium]